jgi:hypothetical protein
MASPLSSSEPGDLDQRELARELEPRAQRRAILRAGLGEDPLADRADDEDPIALHARVRERDGRELVDRHEAIAVGLRPRAGGLELRDDADHRRRGAGHGRHLIARHRQRLGRVRIEHHRRIRRGELELLLEPALRALAEQRPAHAIRHPATTAAHATEIDRAHAQPRGLDRREHRHDGRR